MSVLVFLLVLIRAVSAQDFRSSNWGDTVEQVAAAEQGSEALPDSPDIAANGTTLHALSYSVQFGGQPFRLDMVFCDGHLCQARYTNAFDITDNNYGIAAALYDSLKAKYGPPTGARLNPGMTVGKALMGTSTAAGHAGGFGDGIGNWKTPTTHIMFASNYSALMSSKLIMITYSGNAYVDALNDTTKAIAKGQASGTATAGL